MLAIALQQLFNLNFDDVCFIGENFMKNLSAEMETVQEKRYLDTRVNQPLRRSTDRILQQANAFIASLEIVGDGIILLESTAKISFVSQSARVILQKMETAICIKDNQLLFSDNAHQQILNEFLEKLLVNRQAVSVSEVLVIERPRANRPLILSLCSLSKGDAPRLMLIFRDPDMEPTPQWQVFTRHFNLSAQEARLSLALADGLSLAECSEIFYISLHTARSHLKSIFAKTETRRQSDLLRLIFTFTRL